ncbi:transposase [Noviherbaspirillum cavernae]|uniref:Transposase n=2 Tax=Noviherbaspirillum cavernae TaxID=2320862 RepID=A0A418WWA6_9BURK|nr:transposase [Noviherbaspirillum cavernae]
MRYRRSNIAGGTYFFTVNLADRKSSLLTEHIEVLRNAMRKICQSHPFETMAVVVLPDHLHAIWRLPEGDADFSLRWSLIKAAFSREMPKTEAIRSSRRLKRERGIWQRRYWEHQIRDDDLEKHVAYVHFNPVKHGYVTRASDWPYSSIHREIERGSLDADWGCIKKEERDE